MGLLDTGAGNAGEIRQRFYSDGMSPGDGGGFGAEPVSAGAGDGGTGGTGDGGSSQAGDAGGDSSGGMDGGADAGQSTDGSGAAGTGDGAVSGQGGSDNNNSDAGTGTGGGNSDSQAGIAAELSTSPQAKQQFIDEAIGRLAKQFGIDDLATATEREKKLLNQNAHQLWVIEEGKRTAAASAATNAGAGAGDGAGTIDAELDQFQTEYERTLYGDREVDDVAGTGTEAEQTTTTIEKPPPQLNLPEGTVRAINLFDGLPGHTEVNPEFVLPVLYKDGKDYLAKLDAAAKAGDVDTYLALQDAADIERQHNARPIRKAEFDAWFNEKLGDILPELKARAAQKAASNEITTSFNRAVKDLSSAPNSPMAGIETTMLAPDNGQPVNIGGREYAPTPFNRALAEHPEWMKIRELVNGKVDWRLTHATVLKLAFKHYTLNGGAKSTVGQNGSGATTTSRPGTQPQVNGNGHNAGQPSQTSQAVVEAARNAGVQAGREQVKQEARAGLNGSSTSTAGGGQTQEPNYGTDLRESAARNRIRL